MAVEAVAATMAGGSALQLILVAFLVAVIAAIALRMAQNSLPSKRPPVFEGIPFVGGLLKFAGVSARRSGRLARQPAILRVHVQSHCR